MIIRNRNGAFGELYANRFLRDNNYDIIHTNYRTRRGEIDIIAWDNSVRDKRGKTMVFIEVKALTKTDFMLPREKVNLTKQKHILSAARTFITINRIGNPVRFDIIEIYLDGKEIPSAEKIVHLKSAF